MFEGLHSYEVVLMMMGIVMFVMLAAVMFSYVYRGHKLTTLLPFFRLPVVMIGFQHSRRFPLPRMSCRSKRM
jgi:hypothetical protein